MSLDTDDEPGPQERTMVVDARQLKRPGGPVNPGKPWKPYSFPKLEKVSLNESRLTSRIKWLTPKPEAAEALCTRLKGIFDTQVGFSLEAVRSLGPADLRRHLAEPTFLSFLVPGPHRGRAVLEIELPLAHAAVDTLLGGAGEAVGVRPLTDIEEGVASFVILEAIKALVPGMDPGMPKLRLEGVARGLDEAVTRLSEDGAVLVVQLRARLGSQEGMVRLFVPSGVLDVMEPAHAAEQRRAMLQADIREHLGRLSSVRTWLRAEIAQAEISSRDLASLRVKDVVLVDAFSARPDRGEEGTARLLVGLARRAAWPRTSSWRKASTRRASPGWWREINPSRGACPPRRMRPRRRPWESRGTRSSPTPRCATLWRRVVPWTTEWIRATCWVTSRCRSPWSWRGCR